MQIKETYKELTASQITADALLILDNRGVEAWRQTISAKKNRRGVVKSGVTDIIGHNRKTGLANYCEVKKIGDTFKPKQIEFLISAHQAGCICMVATQVMEKTELVSFIDYYTKYTPNPISGDGLKY